jgi:hypothetical protein
MAEARLGLQSIEQNTEFVVMGHPAPIQKRCR